ncbi:MAG: carboxylating nicotinate-nucleotide diphosphorylase [Opitutales bacterium]|jgi:nicotinate-nucleotide pyrophosphorylase (carboxylating)
MSARAKNLPPPKPAAAFARQLTWKELDPAYLRQLITLAREEDLAGAGLAAVVAPGDVTTAALIDDESARADFVTRRPLTLCGLQLLPFVFDAFGLNCVVTPAPGVNDGQELKRHSRLATVTGPAAVLLKAERTALNFLQKLSGIATHTARHVAALGWSTTKLLDTRKTTPGFRMLEKYAVACGGAWNHRLGLFDRVLIKDNHLAATHATAGERLADSIRRARARFPELLVECEVDAPDQIPPVLAAGVDVVLLDNFSPADLVEAVALIGRRAATEASGGVTLESLPELGRIGLDFISCGALVHQAPWVDIGLDWR